MDKWFNYVDAGFKIVLALAAAWSAYLFGFRKQQNDDVKLVIELVSDASPQKRLMGVGLANAFIQEQRIPEAVFANLLTTLRDDNSTTKSDSKDKVQDKSVQEAANAALNQAASVNSIVQAQLEKSNASLPIRIYFQTANDADRSKANAFGDKVERLAVDPSLNRALNIPDTETVSGYSGQTELRCFKSAECRDVAPKLINLLKTHGATALGDQPVDLSRQYENSNRIRPMHFEVWFAAGKVP